MRRTNPRRDRGLTAIAALWIALCVVSLTGVAEKGPPSTEPRDRPSHIVADLRALSKLPASSEDNNPPKPALPPAKEDERRHEDERDVRAAAWHNIVTEGFEGAFPNVNWSCFADTGKTDAYWDDASSGARVYAGSWSGYCADGGTARVNAPGPYPANMEGWAVYGPFTLHDATDAELDFWHWTYTEGNFYDSFGVYASVDGTNWYGHRWCGDQGGWQSYSLDLTNVYILGNLCGERQVWVAFCFESDADIQYEGTYIDEIVLQKAGKNWTVAMYLAADNSLGGTPPSADFDEIEKALVTSGSNVNVIVLWDDTTANDTTLYWVQPNDVEGSYASYVQDITYWYIPSGWAFSYPDGPEGYPTGSATGTELDMGAQANLTGFLDWVFRNFASDHYALILWNHGGGWEPKAVTSSVQVESVLENGATWKRTFQSRGDAFGKKPAMAEAARQAPVERGVCWDDTSGTFLDTKEVANGIDGSSRRWVDNLGFDACLMQMLEVAYEIYSTPATAADYITGSEETEWGWGWAYHQILAGITASTTPYQLATTWGATREGRFHSGGLDTVSSITVWQVPALASAVSALADRLSTLLGTNARYQEIMYAKLLSLCFAENEYLDLDDFCAWVAAFSGDATAKTLANAVRTQVTSTVIAKSNSSGYSDAGGISIYMPHYHDVGAWGAPHSDYNATNFAFCNDHTWDNFLNSWLATDYPDPWEPNDTPAAATNFGTCAPNVLYLTQEEDFDDSSDDWYKLSIPYPSYLTVYAWCTERSSDTVIYLYDSLANAQANTYFATDDDGLRSSLGLDNYGSYYESSSKLNAGTYYVKVIPYAGSYAANEDYELWCGTSRAPTPAQFRVESSGSVLADGAFYGSGYLTGSADVAEWVPVSESVEPADVLELDPAHPGQYRKSSGICSALVAGVVSEIPGVVLGECEAGETAALLALVGIVRVKVTDEGGAIHRGDLLVPSSRPGYAMRWDSGTSGACGFVGKALEEMAGAEGMILVLLMK